MFYLRLLMFVLIYVFAQPGYAKETTPTHWYNPGKLTPIDSHLKVLPGDKAPDFSLKSIDGRRVSLADFKGRQNVVLSFVPAAWTPVCSDQWPGYNIVKPLFDKENAVLLGLSVDNIPTLQAWVDEMGALWFNVLSDFWPHGAVSDAYGVLRSDGTAERALVFIDREGIVRDVIVSDINVRPDLERVVSALKKMNGG